MVLVTQDQLGGIAIWASGRNPARKVAGKRRYEFVHTVTITTEAGTRTEAIGVVEESEEALQEGIARRFAELFQFDVAAVLRGRQWPEGEAVSDKRPLTPVSIRADQAKLDQPVVEPDAPPVTRPSHANPSRNRRTSPSS